MDSQVQAVQDRRKLLKDTLWALMGTKGYAQTTVTDICREAGIPRRTFYHYFPCKEAVLQAVIEDMLYDSNLTLMLELDAGVDALRKSMIRNFEYWRGSARQKLNLLLDNGLSGEMTRCALRWLETERLHIALPNYLSGKPLKIACMVGISGFFTLLMYWRENEYREPPEEIAEYAMWILSELLYPR